MTRPHSSRLGTLIVILIIVFVVGIVFVIRADRGRQPPAPRIESTGEHSGFALGGTFPREDSVASLGDLHQAAASGGQWIRVDVDWSLVEPRRGMYDWTALDQAFGSAHRGGLKVIGLLSYTPAWARPPGTTSMQPPDDPAAFATFAGAAARRYGSQVDTWEVWNEPNLETYWTSGPDPERYARLLASTSRALRSAHPGVTVLSGGLASVPDTDGRIDPETFVRRLYDLGAGPTFDGVSVHPYTYPTAPSMDPDGVFRRLPALHQQMAVHGDSGKGIWITEFGSPTFEGDRGVTPQQQAEDLSDAFALVRTYPWVRVLLVYTLRDTTTDPTDGEHFGIRTIDNHPKPAWQVFQAEAAKPWVPPVIRR